MHVHPALAAPAPSRHRQSAPSLQSVSSVSYPLTACSVGLRPHRASLPGAYNGCSDDLRPRQLRLLHLQPRPVHRRTRTTEIVVKRNDELTPDEVVALRPRGSCSRPAPAPRRTPASSSRSSSASPHSPPTSRSPPSASASATRPSARPSVPRSSARRS